MKNYLSTMPTYISSVTIVMTSKISSVSTRDFCESIQIDPQLGSSHLHVVEYLKKHPLLKKYYKDYNILSLTFKYSEL